MSDILYVVNGTDHRKRSINVIDIHTFSPFCIPPSNHLHLANLHRHRQQRKRRTARPRRQPHVHGPADKRARDDLKRTHEKHRVRPRPTRQDPTSNLADRFRIAGFLDEDRVLEEEGAGRAAGEDGRDAAHELVLQRAVRVEGEG